MDFFEHQERARRKTVVLVFFFMAAVALIILAVYAALSSIFLVAGKPAPAAGDWAAAAARLWDPDFFIWTACGTILVILAGTLYKTSMLSSGGEAVARMFGARRIPPDTLSQPERRLLNVVEEIAIASGMPPPPVYILDDASINAFAAGFSANDAIIGVTRGCMNLLSRDELQAVIAHEFSHILNGDMRLNIRLMGVLHGILLISLIGWWIFRISSSSSRSSFGGGRSKKGGASIAILLAGLALAVIGYIGVFFARLIKAAVSRQREFLADAASVQFTRNPGGMAGALKKIGGLELGGRIDSPNAEDASHFFFADGLARSFFGLMSTHPALEERVRRIDPSFNGNFPRTQLRPVFAEEEAPSAGAAFASTTARGTMAGAAQLPLAELNSKQALDAVGKMDAGALHSAALWLSALPPALRSAARTPDSARALIMAILLSDDKGARSSQLAYIREKAGQDSYNAVLALEPQAKGCARESLLPLIELASSALRGMRAEDLKAFAAHLRAIVEADGSITLLEYMAQAVVAANIRIWTGRANGPRMASSDPKLFAPAMQVVLSTLAYYGSASAEAAGKAFSAAAAKLPGRPAAAILPQEKCGLQQTDRALSALAGAAPGIKKNFLDACFDCVAHDGKTGIVEAELLRSVAAALDCPVPPLLPSGA